MLTYLRSLLPVAMRTSGEQEEQTQTAALWSDVLPERLAAGVLVLVRLPQGAEGSVPRLLLKNHVSQLFTLLAMERMECSQMNRMDRIRATSFMFV